MILGHDSCLNAWSEGPALVSSVSSVFSKLARALHLSLALYPLSSLSSCRNMVTSKTKPYNNGQNGSP